MVEISKSDWKLYRSKLPDWQEAYMEKLIKEYSELLSQEGKASEKFWKLNDRIKEDRKKSGVIVEIRKSEMLFQILQLLHDGAITMEDLSDFSEDLQDTVKHFTNRK